MAHTIGIGESIVIPQREITEEMHDRRVSLGLAPKNHLENGANAKILRAYTRPRGQEAVEIEVTPDGVKVTALARGYALVDVIDDISEPAGHDVEFYVVRQPQLEKTGSDKEPANPLAKLTAKELAAIGMKRAEFAVEGGTPLTPVFKPDAEKADPKEAAAAAVKATSPAPIEVAEKPATTEVKADL